MVKIAKDHPLTDGRENNFCLFFVVLFFHYFHVGLTCASCHDNGSVAIVAVRLAS